MTIEQHLDRPDRDRNGAQAVAVPFFPDILIYFVDDVKIVVVTAMHQGITTNLLPSSSLNRTSDSSSIFRILFKGMFLLIFPKK